MTGQSGGIYNSYSAVAMDIWRRKPTLSSGCALGLSLAPCYNYNINRPASHDRTIHVFGIEEVPPQEVVLLDVEDESKEQLKVRIRELEKTVTELKLRVSQLEEQLHATLTATSSLTTQADLLLHEDLSVCHGPNKITNFNKFSLKQNAPSLYSSL